MGALVAVLVVGASALAFAALRAVPSATGVADYTPAPQPTQARQPIVLFIGDSYAAGAGASTATKRWTALVSSELGWRQNNHAFGGTGYATSTNQGCGLDHCPTFLEAITALDADPITPDIVVISGGRNDGPSLAELGDRVAATITTARSQWPNAQIVVTNPMWDARATPSWFAEGADAVRTATIENGATYLDLGQPLSGRPELITDDNVHPNDDGHAAIAGAFAEAWARTQSS